MDPRGVWRDFLGAAADVLDKRTRQNHGEIRRVGSSAQSQSGLKALKKDQDGEMQISWEYQAPPDRVCQWKVRWCGV